ncbi:MAG: hypothetical protein MR598_00515 [Erysipelotrichaceae bacterium]|nr:hypothetical protein [Erysipelotrichaceae bacterium]
MKKKNTGNTGVIVITIVIILLGLAGAYLWKENKLGKNTEDQGGTTTVNQNFNEVEERESLNQDIQEIEASLGFLAILTSVDKYNGGGDYVTKKGVNLLEATEDKQLFVMEQIVRNSENDKNFVVLDMNGEVDKEITSPTTDGATAYYPADLFKTEYAKYFKETFSMKDRKVSSNNNQYDQDSNYVYYENRRPGLNGLSVTGITIEKIEKNTTDTYLANITLHYNDRTSSMLGASSEEAELIYSRRENIIQIESYKLK